MRSIVDYVMILRGVVNNGRVRRRRGGGGGVDLDLDFKNFWDGVYNFFFLPPPPSFGMFIFVNKNNAGILFHIGWSSKMILFGYVGNCK